MKILSIECSASPCSAAITENGKIIDSDFVNVGLTHSQILMPIVEKLLAANKMNISDIDVFAVSAGPGSFTGIRIGISAIKGLAAPSKKPCIPISTLLSMAYNYIDTECIICAVMDARCNQVYNALFDITDNKINRICDDRALMCEELANNLREISKKSNKKIIIIGDGTDVFYPYTDGIENIEKSEDIRRFQNAASVSLAATESLKNGDTVSPEAILPVYLRLPQAERELKLKKENEK